MKMIETKRSNAFHYETPLGAIILAETGGKITHLIFEGEKFAEEEYERKETPVLAEAARQVEEYFKGSRTEFDLPLAPSGTEFMLRVWKALQEIPYGETRSYKDIAIRADCGKGFRAVGLANNRNPIAIIIPCHRVIGSNGQLVGYGGGLDKKRFLLDLEKFNLDRSE